MMAAYRAMLSEKLARVLGQLPYLPRQLALVWDATRGWTAVWLILVIVQGLLPAVTVRLTRSLVNSVVLAINAHGAWPAVRPRCTWRS